MKEKTFNNKKWELWYQGWLPYDKELNEYFEQQRLLELKKHKKKSNKKNIKKNLDNKN